MWSTLVLTLSIIIKRKVERLYMNNILGATNSQNLDSWFIFQSFLYDIAMFEYILKCDIKKLVLVFNELSLKLVVSWCCLYSVQVISNVF